MFISILLFVIGWLLDPEWISKFLKIGENRYVGNNWFYPILWGYIYMISGSDIRQALLIHVPLNLILLAFLLYVFIKYRHQLTSEDAIGLVLPAAIMLAPYLWAYDQILLLFPIIYLTGALVLRQYPYLITATIPIWISVLSLIILMVAQHVGNDSMSVWITVISLVMAFLAMKWRVASLILERI